MVRGCTTLILCLTQLHIMYIKLLVSSNLAASTQYGQCVELLLTEQDSVVT